jgi:hypothetical protein
MRVVAEAVPEIGRAETANRRDLLPVSDDTTVVTL